jgi:hypothetical protein
MSMSRTSEHPVTCLEEGCPASFPGSKFDAIRAQEAGWFFPREHEGLRGWCPAHVPSWVPAWRARKAAGS